MGQKIGYARDTKHEDTISEQIDMLAELGCSEIFTEIGHGGCANKRPVLKDVMKKLKRGDVLVITSFERLADESNVAIRILTCLILAGVKVHCAFDGPYITKNGIISRGDA